MLPEMRLELTSILRRCRFNTFRICLFAFPPIPPNQARYETDYGTLLNCFCLKITSRVILRNNYSEPYVSTTIFSPARKGYLNRFWIKSRMTCFLRLRGDFPDSNQEPGKSQLTKPRQKGLWFGQTNADRHLLKDYKRKLSVRFLYLQDKG